MKLFKNKKQQKIKDKTKRRLIEKDIIKRLERIFYATSNNQSIKYIYRKDLYQILCELEGIVSSD